MALSGGGPSPLASQTQPTATANGSRSPEHSEDGCSWCDEGRLEPGTRPPTSGKSVTETVTPPTHAHPVPPAPSCQLRGPPQPTARLGSALPGSLGRASAPAYLIRQSIPLSQGLGGGRGGAGGERGISAPPHPPPSRVAPRPKCSRDALGCSSLCPLQLCSLPADPARSGNVGAGSPQPIK